MIRALVEAESLAVPYRVLRAFSFSRDGNVLVITGGRDLSIAAI